MKKLLTLLSLILTCGAASADVLDDMVGLTRVTQIEEGKCYYIVSDRTKFNYQTGGDGGTDGNMVQVKAMCNYQSGFTATNWDNPGNNIYFVYYGDLSKNSNGFVWKAEKMGDQWSFYNMGLEKYMGHNNPGETDLRFADDAVGFTLTDLSEGEGRWAFTNSDYTTPLNVHQYPVRKSRGVLALAQWSDANATDKETYGYPGRWRLYETTEKDEPEGPTGSVVDELMGLLRINSINDFRAGEEYFIVSDRTAYSGNTSGTPKAISTQQDSYSVKWGNQYVYWGDIDTTADGFAWTVEEMPGDMWAFKNKENGLYLGSNNTGESDVIFSDTPVGYTLTDLTEGAGKFAFFGNDEEPCLHVQGYGRSDRANNSVNLVTEDIPSDAATGGYPGRWHIYVKGTTQVKDLDNLKDGTDYYIVSDRKKFSSSTSVSLRAMSTQQDSYTIKWGDNYVYWGEMDKNADGFIWTAEKVGTQWAFKNKENGRYLGNMNTGESDVIFSDTPVGYTLTDLTEGAGKYSFINDESEFSLHVQGYMRTGRSNNSLAKQENGADDYSADAATAGYPGRWLLYEANTVESGEEPVYDPYHYDTINVVSYNIQHCQGMDGKVNVQRTADVINSFNPTAVALQEIDKNYSDRSNFEDQVQLLAKATGMYGKFGTAGINCGNAVLTKEKPLSYKVLDIGDGRNMIVAELQDYVFASIHVGLYSVNVRLVALQHIREEAARWESKGKPFILAGDFNDDGTYAEMAGVWGLLCDSLAKTFTFHSDRVTPTYHGPEGYVIDHIISYDKIGGVKTMSYEVKQSDASDHFPIMAQLRVGFPKPLTPAEVREIISDAQTKGDKTVDMRELTFDPDVTADDLAAEGNVIVYAPDGSALEGTNIVTDGTCQHLVLTDGQPFAPTEDFTAATATYQRTMDSEWGTICLPYAVTSDESAEYYTITRIEGNTLIVEKIDELAAGTPALVRTKFDGQPSTVNIQSSMANVQCSMLNNAQSSIVNGQLSMNGLFEDTTVSDPNAYYIKDDKFWQSDGPFLCEAFRAYLVATDAATSTFDIVIDDPTGLTTAPTPSPSLNGGKCYDLSGRRVTSPFRGMRGDPGIYIVKRNGNTQKVIVRK